MSFLAFGLPGKGLSQLQVYRFLMVGDGGVVLIGIEVLHSHVYIYPRFLISSLEIEYPGVCVEVCRVVRLGLDGLQTHAGSAVEVASILRQVVGIVVQHGVLCAVDAQAVIVCLVLVGVAADTVEGVAEEAVNLHGELLVLVLIDIIRRLLEDIDALFLLSVHVICRGEEV